MATLTPTLTLASTDAFANQAISLSTTIGSTVSAPMADISRMATNDNIGHGAGIILPEASSTTTTFVYVKHLGILASDFSTASHASNDFVLLKNADADISFIKLQPNEFCFFPLQEFDGSDGGVEPGGLKVIKGSADVVIEFAYFTRG
tara:strand:+ start:351 stop:794 length:444 start_codon:yes stop_codon:yes gene_type:complete